MEDLGAKQRSLDLPRLIDEVKQSELLIGLFTAIWTRVVVESGLRRRLAASDFEGSVYCRH
jgi:hypothetical protein